MEVVTLEEAKARGYCITSRAHQRATRIDREDWREVMARRHVDGMRWVRALGPRAADHYRRCYSRDHINVPRSWISALGNSGSGPTEFTESSCPNVAHTAEHACSNRLQCWEPCGELGKSEEHTRPALREAPCDSPMAPAAALTERHKSEPGGKNERPLPQGPQDASLSAVLRENEILKGHLALLLDCLYDPDAVPLLRIRVVKRQLDYAGIAVTR